MLNTSAFEIRATRSLVTERQIFQPELVDDLPDVPALPETLLLLELRTHEYSVDLREVSQLVLGDLGATIQVLRLAHHEYGGAEGSPVRIEDCISDLGLQACLTAAASSTVIGDVRHRAIFDTWAHSREIAQYCRLVAEEISGDIHPDEAYLVGLFHTLGQLPAVLDWNWNGNLKDWTFTGLRLAERWSLPRCVREFFLELRQSPFETPWQEIVRTAHLAARMPSVRCPLQEDIVPQLHKGA